MHGIAGAGKGKDGKTKDSEKTGMREAEKMGGGGRELGWLEAAILIGSILTFIVDQATGGSHR